MPAWWAPQALDTGIKIAGGLLGGKSDEQKAAEARQKFDEREAGYDRYTDERALNQRLGSDAYKNPMKTALLDRMMGKVGVSTGGMGLPQAARTYAKPAPINAEREAKMAEWTPDAVKARLQSYLSGGPRGFMEAMRNNPNRLKTVQAAQKLGLPLPTWAAAMAGRGQ